MKKKVKRMLAGLLPAVALIISLAACDAPEPTGGSTDQPKTEAAEQRCSVAEQLAGEYTLIRGAQATGSRHIAAQAVVYDAIRDAAGTSARAGLDQVKEAFDAESGYVSDQPEVLIGHTNRRESIEAAKTLGAMDYLIEIKGDKVIILGGTSFGTVAAAEKFGELLESGEIRDLSQPYTYKYEFLKENELHPFCTDFSSFVPVWTGTYQPPVWVGDFRETLFTATHSRKNGAARPATFAHRGDMTYYPEGSMEAMVSAYLGGADLVEIDFWLTRDQIPVSFHDGTLKDKTNWAEMAGKNGLPTSASITDWTYEELKQLSFLHNGEKTDCRIVSVYEMLLFTGGRVLVTLDDKGQVGYDLEEDLFPLACETDSIDSFYRELRIDTAKAWAQREEVSDRYREITRFFEKCMEHKGSHISGSTGFSSTDQFYKPPFNGDWESQAEDEPLWAGYIEDGVRMIWTNRIVALCNYLAETGGPSDYSFLLEQ